MLVLEAWDANHNWLDPRDKVEDSPRIKVDPTDHPAGIGVVLGDFSVIRVKDTSRIKKDGKYYVLDRDRSSRMLEHVGPAAGTQVR